MFKEEAKMGEREAKRSAYTNLSAANGQNLKWSKPHGICETYPTAWLIIFTPPSPWH
jgi:hypothetical protein